MDDNQHKSENDQEWHDYKIIGPTNKCPVCQSPRYEESTKWEYCKDCGYYVSY